MNAAYDKISDTIIILRVDIDHYGPGNDVNAPIIALGKAWGYHMGHFLADQQYGVSSSCHAEQTDANGFGIAFCPNPPTNTDHANILVLENFNPTLSSDPFRWIPKGLMEDMMDIGEPTSTYPVNDQVSGFSIAQLFNALQSDISSVTAYKTRIIQQNPGNQTTQVGNLFSSYNY